MDNVLIGTYKARAEGRGLSVVLPQGWVKQQAIKATDKLDLSVDKDGRLVVSKSQE